MWVNIRDSRIVKKIEDGFKKRKELYKKLKVKALDIKYSTTPIKNKKLLYNLYLLKKRLYQIDMVFPFTLRPEFIPHQAGPCTFFLNKLCRKIGKFLLKDYIDKQKNFNEAVIEAIEELTREINEG
ncbi:hypothetical protein KAW65_03685 [candidate division WOR-3 bacterium]|nr:hypothetical protein [candidate division WOR-3 bacterium]